MFLRRRRLVAASGLAATGLVLPRFAIGQADQRPHITIAVQQIANSASLEPLREQSNVGQRVFSFLFERLIMQDLLGKLDEVPGLAESWKRIDARTVEFVLRKGVKFHNGDPLTAEDVKFSFERYRGIFAKTLKDRDAPESSATTKSGWSGGRPREMARSARSSGCAS